jgi:hypothetical protein
MTYGSVSVAANPRAGGLSLAAPTPNPAPVSATFRFTLPRTQTASLAVFDLGGRRVAQVVDGLLPAGSHAVEWRTEGVGAGLYFARLKTIDGERTVRIAVSH